MAEFDCEFNAPQYFDFNDLKEEDANGGGGAGGAEVGQGASDGGASAGKDGSTDGAKGDDYFGEKLLPMSHFWSFD